MTRVCLECGGACWIVNDERDYRVPIRCPECDGWGVEPHRFDTGTTASDVGFLNQIANDAMDGRGTE